MIKYVVWILLFTTILTSSYKLGTRQSTSVKSEPVLKGWEISKFKSHLPNYRLSAFSFVNAQIGFAVGWNGGIYKITDARASWLKQYSGTTLHLVSVFFLNKNIGFVGGEAMKCLDDDCNKGCVLLKTTNGGAIWTKLFFKDYACFECFNFFDSLNGLAIIRTPSIPNSAYYHLAKTTDGGNNWNFIDLAIQPVDGKFFCVDNVIFIAGKNNKIYKSKDHGNTWQAINTTIPTSNYVRGIYFYNENIGFIDGIKNIYKTTNGGLSWETVDCPFSLFGIFHFCNENEGFNIETVKKYEGGEAPAFKGIICYQTWDGGKSWSKSNLIDSLYLGVVYFPQKDLGYEMNYVLKKR